MSTRGTARRVGVVASGIAAMLAVAPGRAHAQQSTLHAEWSRNATEYRGQIGRRVTMLCPPQGQVADVWGTDAYTDDSAVCSAAELMTVWKSSFTK